MLTPDDLLTILHWVDVVREYSPTPLDEEELDLVNRLESVERLELLLENTR
jgi:hypothetical protein